MARYLPRSAKEWFYYALQHAPGRIGRRARAKMKRALGDQAVADFDRLLATVGSGDICLDVGANVGDFTARLAATGAEVHCYEPDPYAFALLGERWAGRPGIHLHQAALGAKAGVAQLRRSHRFADEPRRNSQSSTIVFDDPGRYAAETIEVEVRSFRDELQRLGRPVAIAKLDIEGAEFAILEQVFASPADFPVAAMFVETHERDDPALRRTVARMRLAAEALARPSINLYWP